MIRRAQIWDARLNPVEGSEQAGTRPVLIVSRDALNASSPVVVVVPLTRRANKAKLYPSHVVIEPGGSGLDHESVALCEQVRAISKNRLQRRRGEVGSGVMEAVCRALAVVVACEGKTG